VPGCGALLVRHNGPGTRTTDKWFNPAAFAAPPAFTFGNVGRNSVYTSQIPGPGGVPIPAIRRDEYSLAAYVILLARQDPCGYPCTDSNPEKKMSISP
jgi:hypothetical protein